MLGVGSNSMKSILLVAIGTVALGAQQPAAPSSATRNAPAGDTTRVVLDRIIAVVRDQPLTQYDVQERILAMGQQPGFHAPTSQAEYDKLEVDIVNQLVDEEILVQKAK